MNERDARWWIDHYGVHIALVALFALTLHLAPSKAATQPSASDRAGSGSSAPGPSGTGSATTTGTAPGAGGANSTGGAGGGGSTGSGSAEGGGAGPAGDAGYGEDCSRTEILGARFGCMPLADGTNAGATYPGVAADRVTIVVHLGRTDPQAEAVLGDQGFTNDPALVASQTRAYAEWLQQHFQTWGRAVDLKIFQSQAGIGDTARYRAEAVQIAQEFGAFIVVSNGSTDDFVDEITRRGVICFCYSLLRDRAPFLYLSDDGAYTAHFAEFVCKRLGPTADHAGPGLTGKPRVYGYVHSQVDTTAEEFKALLAQCGIAVTREGAYAEDITTAVQQATNLVQQMKSAGVTTVLWPGRPYIAMYFAYAAAKNQQFYPEWVTGADGYFEGRFLDQDQMSRNFGISDKAVPRPESEEPWYKIYTQLRPGQTIPRPGFDLGLLVAAFLGLERAGPALDPASVAQGLSTVHIPSTNPHETVVDFTPRSGEMTEVWWDRNAVGPDGKLGAFQWVNGGKRYPLGAWPQTPAHPFQPECTPAGSCGEAP